MGYKERVDLFIESVYRYIKMFNLGEYDVVIEPSDDKNIFGSCEWFDYEDGTQSIIISFSKPWFENAKEITRHEIKEVAFHEVCELLLSELNQIANERFIEKREITKAVHRIVRRLEFLATEEGFL